MNIKFKIKNNVFIILVIASSLCKVHAASIEKSKNLEPVPYIYIPVLSKNSEFLTLSASTLFQVKTYNDSSKLQSVGKLLNYKELLNNHLGHLNIDDNFIRTSFVETPVVKIADKENVVFKATVEFAGNSSLIPQFSMLSIHQGLRLGFDTSKIYYEMPMNLERYNHTKQTQMIVLGNLHILPLNVRSNENAKAFMEANFSNIIIKNNGNVSIGRKFLSKGFHAQNSKITFYDSIISAPYINSNNDLISIYGNVRFIAESKEPSVLNSHILLNPSDTYHASEIVHKINDSVLHLDGHFNAKSSWVYAVAMDSNKNITFPKVKTSIMNHFKNVAIEIDALVFECYQTEPENILKNTRFSIIESRAEILTLPKIGYKTQEMFKKLKVKLILSSDKKTVYIAFE